MFLEPYGTVSAFPQGCRFHRSWSRAMRFQGCNRGVQEHDIAIYVS